MHSPSALTKHVSLNLAGFFCTTLYSTLGENSSVNLFMQNILCHHNTENMSKLNLRDLLGHFLLLRLPLGLLLHLTELKVLECLKEMRKIEISGTLCT